MKYLSLIDLAGFSLDQISNLDANGIIRLKKQLKAKAMLGNASNIGEIIKIVDELSNESVKQCHLFVENHIWLKQLITGNYNEIKLNEIDVNSLLIEDLEALRYFLNKYLKENLKLFLTDALKKGNCEHILKILKHNYLFTEEVNQLVINFFRSRLNFATTYLSEGKLKEKIYPIAYVGNKTFIKCLNIYPDAFNEEIQELNSEVIEIYNLNRKKTERDTFKFAAKVMVALSILDTSNIFLKDNLESNARIAREYTLPSLHKNKSKSSFSAWNIIFIFFILIRLVVWFSKSNSNSSNYDTINIGNYKNSSNNIESMNKIDSIIKSYQNAREVNADSSNTSLRIDETSTTNNTSVSNKYKLSNHIKFIYTMKRKVEQKSFSDINPVKLAAFSNPYPRTFNAIPFIDYNTTDSSYILVNNRSEKDLIVFRLTEGIDQSLYIPKNEKISIELKDKDSIVLYAGKNFVKSNFSHFKTETDLTHLYKIKNTNTSPREITIYPFTEKVKKINSLSSNRVIVVKNRTESIKAKNLDLKELSIDAIYTDYYNKKYRN